MDRQKVLNEPCTPLQSLNNKKIAIDWIFKLCFTHKTRFPLRLQTNGEFCGLLLRL